MYFYQCIFFFFFFLTHPHDHQYGDFMYIYKKIRSVCAIKGRFATTRTLEQPSFVKQINHRYGIPMGTNRN